MLVYKLDFLGGADQIYVIINMIGYSYNFFIFFSGPHFVIYCLQYLQ